MFANDFSVDKRAENKRVARKVLRRSKEYYVKNILYRVDSSLIIGASNRGDFFTKLYWQHNMTSFQTNSWGTGSNIVLPGKNLNLSIH